MFILCISMLFVSLSLELGLFLAICSYNLGTYVYLAVGALVLLTYIIGLQIHILKLTS